MENSTVTPTPDPDIKMADKHTLTPPTSEDADKHGNSDSELSDLELDKDDGGEILPDHYYEGGKIPVFKPVSLRPVLALQSIPHKQDTKIPAPLKVDVVANTRSAYPDHRAISKLQQIHPQDRQVWDEIGHRQSHSTKRMVSNG